MTVWKKINFSAIAFSVVTATLVQCDQNEAPESPYPRIETLPIKNINDGGATFEAKFISPGNQSIINHGFVWGTSQDIDLKSNDNIKLGAVPKIGNYKVDVKSGLYEGKTYFVKAFAATRDYLVYSDAVSFTGKDARPSVIESLEPSAGTSGDTVVVKGHRFSDIPKDNLVTFNNESARVLVSNDSQILCLVPNNLPGPKAMVAITVGGKQSQSTAEFTLTSPIIENFYPPGGKFGTWVQIEGKNFGAVKERIVVRFSNSIAEVITASRTRLTVKVPETIATKENNITVSLNLQSATSAENFIISPPDISRILPFRAFPDQLIEIEGGGFSPASSYNTVKIGGILATVVSSSSNLLKVRVPSGLSSGVTVVELTVAEQTASSTILIEHP